MTLTAEQLVARRERVGASDVAAIMGVPTFVGVNAWTVWADKIGALEDERGNKPWLDEGNRLEPFILNWAERELGALDRNVVVHDPGGARIASTLDGRVIATGVPVEAKTSGIFGPVHGEWGQDGTDEVPDGYLLQCQTQLLCTGAEVCRLFALLGGRGRVEYQIHPHPALIAKIRDVAEDFYASFVVTKIDPREGWAERLEKAHGITVEADPCAPSLSVVKRLRRVPDKSIELPNPERFIEWQNLREARLSAEKAENAAEAALLADIGEAQAGLLPGGMYLERCVEKGSFTYDRAAMEADGVFERYATQGTRNVLRVRGAKKGR